MPCDQRSTLPDSVCHSFVEIGGHIRVVAVAGAWWPPGHIIGYEHTFVHAMADFVNAVADNKPVQPDFQEGLANQSVLAAVEISAKTHRWVKL